ncbi:hypothetical protein [Empedobacter sp.]|uniref:hypothetical protein n=1 Tax=Empedobacter sp. TaxID=1927715 RepID=UPI0028A874E6|nr:hypothetical protein [Empedobacter sp.]
MTGIYIISIVISILISYYLIFLAVKNALSGELKKTNELLTKLISDNNKVEVSDILLEDEVNNEDVSIYPKGKILYKYFTLSGVHLLIFSSSKISFQNGDLAFIEKEPAKDGVYKLSLFDSITVKDGKVVK